MSVVREVRARLAALEERVEPALRPEVQAIRGLLADPERQWIGTVEAQRLLGVQSINTVKAWARLGILRSRREQNGRIKVHLEDVLREAQAQHDLERVPEPDETRAAPAEATLAPALPNEGEALVRTIVERAAAREQRE